jgi:hypothetical protein
MGQVRLKISTSKMSSLAYATEVEENVDACVVVARSGRRKLVSFMVDLLRKVGLLLKSSAVLD